MIQPLPKSDPFAMIRSFTAPRRNQLAGLAAGLLSANDWGPGMAAGFAQAAQGRQADDAYAATQKAEAERQAQLQKTISYLRTQPGGATWADAVEGGFVDPKEAFQSWYAESKPKTLEPTANMRDYQFAQQNPGYADFLNPADSGGKKPASVQEYEYAKSQGYEGTFNDYQTQQKQAARGPMNATTQKELFEADEGIQAGVAVSQALDRALELNSKSGEGPFSDFLSQGGALLGDETSINTQELKNLVTSQALDQLKATFGSMPTEGERKILLEIQGSVEQSKPVRERIFRRAKAAVERRVKYNQSKAEGLRSGEYFQEGYGASAPATGGDDVEDILKGLGL